MFLSVLDDASSALIVSWTR